MRTKVRYMAAAGIAGLMVLGISAGAWGTGAGLNPNLMNPTPTPSPYVQECIDKWQDAPAYSYCSSASVTRNGTAGGSGKCVVDGSCSVTATVGGDEASDGSMGVGVTTWTPNVDLTLKKRNTDSIDICFSAVSGLYNPFTTVNGWEARVRKVCRSTETTVADAVANDLSEVTSENLSAVISAE